MSTDYMDHKGRHIPVENMAEEQGLTVDELCSKWVGHDAVPACCTQGCMVEPDGECRHGWASIFMEAE